MELPAVAVAIATVGSARLEPRASPAWDSSGNSLVHIMVALNSRIIKLFGLVHCQCNRIHLSWVLIEVRGSMLYARSTIESRADIILRQSGT